MTAQHPTNPTMAEAIKAAGIAPPVIRRVWNVIKESGRAGILGPELVARLSAIPRTNVDQAANELRKRAMVSVTQERTPSGRLVYRYTTDMDTYELLPRLRQPPSAPANPTGLAKAPATAPTAPVVPTTPVATASAPDAETLNALSLGCVMSAWIKAGMDPSAVLLMPVSQFIRAAAKRGLVVTLTGE